MKMFSDVFRTFSSIFITVVYIGENIPESSKTNFKSLPLYVFDVDHVAKIRSELSITVVEKNVHTITV